MIRINSITKKIDISQGDNAGIRIDAQYLDGKPYQVQTDDIITLTVRRNLDDKETAISKKAVNGVVSFVPEDTKQLEAGLYVYDVQLTTATGNIYTIIPTSLFEILKEVSR